MSDDSQSLLERLRAHRTLSNAPDTELEWLIAHGSIRRFALGDRMVRKGEPADGMYILLKGKASHHMDAGGVWHKMIEWTAGDVTGQLPYSRMTVAPGQTIVDEPGEVLFIPRQYISELPTVCPEVTAALVHAMLDRARTFKTSDLQLEKLASLGKLAAGLAHELNNPASAATRSARLVSSMVEETDAAARALGAAHLSPSEMAVIERVRESCFAAPATTVRSPLERADREEEIGTWLAGHGLDESYATPIAETDVPIATLDELAGALPAEKLGTVLRWVSAGCSLRGLARDIERAASRVHALVSAVKGFTYMDHATVPEPVDVGKGLTDTLALLAAKARGKSASLTIESPDALPRARGFGGELNQVWANLVDNALDAIAQGGRVVVTARAKGQRVEVRVTDDGPGIPADVKSKIFDPFFTTKPVGQGTGLGLDIVRRLVDHNGGTIDVDSVPGKTEFTVALPLSE